MKIVSSIQESDAQALASNWRPGRCVALLCILGWLHLSAPEGFALDPLKSLSQYTFRTWTRERGLPAKTVNALAQTQDGHLYLGTERGLIRFDGVEFDELGIGAGGSNLVVNSMLVRALTPASDGGLWFGVYEGGYGKLHPPLKWEYSPGQSGNANVIVETGAGELLVGPGSVDPASPAGHRPETLMQLPPELASQISAAHESADGRLWLGTAGSGLWYREAGALHKVQAPELDTAITFAIAQGLDGTVWVGTHAGLRCLGPDLKPRPFFFPMEVKALLVDSNGAVWVGSSGMGVARIQGDSIDYFRKEHGLASDRVLALMQDADQNLWIGTDNGLTQILDVRFPTLTEFGGIRPASVQSVHASPRGGMWIASSDGAIYRDPQGSAVAYSTNAGLGNAYVKRVFEAANGEVFVVSGKNEVEILADGKVVARHATPGMPVAMAEDEHGVVISVGGELHLMDRAGLRPYPFPEAKPELYWILNLATAPDGALWVACVNGVWRIHKGVLTQWTAERDKLPSQNVRMVYPAPEGVVWVGTDRGIARIKDDKAEAIGPENGLWDTNIRAVVPDDQGNLWVTSVHRLFQITKESLDAFFEGSAAEVRIIDYDGEQNVKGADRSQQENSGFKSEDGRIFFPGSAGVVMINPRAIPRHERSPQVYIKEVRANRVRHSWPESLTVPPGGGDLEIRYSAPMYIAPEQASFQYMLKGHDADWTEPNHTRQALYKGLKPGLYEFQVRAANADGIWSEAATGLSIRLQPHFYQTLWFRALCASLAAGSVLALWWWEAARRRSTRVLLEKQVKERTEELAKANASLAGQIAERKRIEVEVERVHQQLVAASRQAGMAEMATGVLHNVGNVLNSVNVSATLVASTLERSKIDGFTRATALLSENIKNLGSYLSADPKGRHVPGYLIELSSHVAKEKALLQKEVKHLQENIAHIEEIVAMQQNHARMSGVEEKVPVASLVEDSLKVNSGALARHDVTVVRAFRDTSEITTDRHKVIQILVNLIRNAKYACDEAERPDKILTLEIDREGANVRIRVRDNGVGIPAENLGRIFTMGFTTRAFGHGFGLHSAALAAQQLGGSLTAHSDGPGKGACFTLVLPRAFSGRPANN